MTVLIIGGTGFIGRRLIPLLAQRGEESVVMDINPQTANFSELTKVKVLRGDISQFDDARSFWRVAFSSFLACFIPSRLADTSR